MKSSEFKEKLRQVGVEYSEFKFALVFEIEGLFQEGMYQWVFVQRCELFRQLDKAIDILRCAFRWDCSPQGAEFWKDVAMKLYELECDDEQETETIEPA